MLKTTLKMNGSVIARGRGWKFLNFSCMRFSHVVMVTVNHVDYFVMSMVIRTKLEHDAIHSQFDNHVFFLSYNQTECCIPTLALTLILLALTDKQHGDMQI